MFFPSFSLFSDIYFSSFYVFLYIYIYIYICTHTHIYIYIKYQCFINNYENLREGVEYYITNRDEWRRPEKTAIIHPVTLGTGLAPDCPKLKSEVKLR